MNKQYERRKSSNYCKFHKGDQVINMSKHVNLSFDCMDSEGKRFYSNISAGFSEYICEKSVRAANAIISRLMKGAK